MSASTQNANIASKLSDMARLRPNEPAIHHPRGRGPDGRLRYETATYAELDAESDAIAAGLESIGIGAGTRTALMVKPSPEFFALVFALFKAGAVPVVVDPGIGHRSLKQCLGESEPEAFIGIPAAHAARVLLGWGRDTIRIHVTVGRRWFWGGHTLSGIRARGRQRGDWRAPDLSADDVAAILFTSGSTGVPKGVIYRHGNFMAQVEMIRQTYDIQPGEIDLPTFPLFALFDPALGMTTVVPDMDPRKPAHVDPTKIIDAIERFGVTNMFGSPALLNRVGRYGQARGVQLSTLKRVISAGAPVPAQVMSRFLSMLDDDARVHTPYGATESLPVASISSADVLGETGKLTDQGLGVCVGRPVEGADVRVIEIRDEAIAEWRDDLELPQGEIGEICVAGPMVTSGYYGRPAQDDLSKIVVASTEGGVGHFRHRMGDVGYFDERGRLWFCGRKAQRVVLDDGETLFTVPCEGVFNTHPGVYRSALVAVVERGTTEPVICVEMEPKGPPMTLETLRAELAELGEGYPHTRRITRFVVHPDFPVDIRHNTKIGREALGEWARGRR